MRQLLIVILVVCLLPSSWALDIHVCEFQSTSESDKSPALDSRDFTDGVFKLLCKKDVNGLLGFRFQDRKSTQGIVASELDAVKACEINGWEVAVYGYVYARSYGYDVEMKIYSHPDRVILKTFLLRSSPDDKDALVKDCASRIYDYFSDLMKLEKDKSAFIPDGNMFIMTHGIEWWSVSASWRDIMVPIVGYQGRLGYRLGDPLWTDGEWALLQEYGCGLGFHYAKNDNTVILGNLFDIDIGPDASYTFLWQRKQEIGITVEPCAKIHVLRYQPLYDSAKTDLWVWYGFKTDIEYRFWLNSKRTWGIGLRGGLGAYFVDPTYIDYHIGVDWAWKGFIK